MRPGDEVMGEAQGSFAVLAIARPEKLARKPARLSFEQAAAVPVSGVTALQALRDVAKLRAGHRVLVIGAAGGVGRFVVQIAKAFGAEVTGVCGTAKLDLVRSIGADKTSKAKMETAGTRRFQRLRAGLYARPRMDVQAAQRRALPKLSPLAMRNAHSANSSICCARNRRSASVDTRSAARSKATRASSRRPSRRNIVPRAACIR